MMLNKSAPIDDTLIMMNHNIEGTYATNAAIAVNEQVIPYSGRTRFTLYIPSKPVKYSFKEQIYTGKRLNNERND